MSVPGRSASTGRIRDELRPSGYLVGDVFGVADLTAAALLSPLRLPSGFPYPPEGPLPRLFTEYRNELLRHPAWDWIEEIYRRHRGTSAEVW